MLAILPCGIEGWAHRKEDRVRLGRNDQALLRWVCDVKLHKHLGIMPLATYLRLSWLGHITCSEGWINLYLNLDMVGKRKGWP